MATRTQTPLIPSTKRGRFLGFLAVGATGLVINQLAFWLLTDVFGLYYLWGFLLATQFSTAWNFVLLERWIDNWQDLMEFEIIPVRTSAEVVELMKRKDR